MVAAGNKIILLGLDSGKMDISRLFLLNVIILSVLKQCYSANQKYQTIFHDLRM